MQQLCSWESDSFVVRLLAKLSPQGIGLVKLDELNSTPYHLFTCLLLNP